MYKIFKGCWKNPLERFQNRFFDSGAAERYLQVSIECVIDIGNEIISLLQLKRPERYGDVPSILAEAGIIPEDFESVMASMIGFRDLLIHDYASINLELVYEFLQTKISDFEIFSRYIAKWLEGLSRH
ncbi:DUF86 domain-containing protein [Candidatus Bathyarchaeota archaeon]|nr:DUF86 domain-containing protein [Candidatus Bathyarchaeota archaeon]